MAICRRLWKPLLFVPLKFLLLLPQTADCTCCHSQPAVPTHSDAVGMTTNAVEQNDDDHHCISRTNALTVSMLRSVALHAPVSAAHAPS